MLPRKSPMNRSPIRSPGTICYRSLIGKLLVTSATVLNSLKPRCLLIDLQSQLEYDGNRQSFLAASEAFRYMGKQTGAFDVTVSEDPALFDKERHQQFDAVFLDNSIGACTVEHERCKTLLEFVTGGGGLLGVMGPPSP